MVLNCWLFWYLFVAAFGVWVGGALLACCVFGCFLVELLWVWLFVHGIWGFGAGVRVVVFCWFIAVGLLVV